MSSPLIYPIPNKRDWLWKHELAEVFCITRQTLRKWVLRLIERYEIADYDPMCRKLRSHQIEQLCELLGYNYSDCLSKMDNMKHYKRIDL